MSKVTELHQYTAEDTIHSAMWHLADNAKEVAQAIHVLPMSINLNELSDIIRTLLHVHHERTRLEMVYRAMERGRAS